jgi:hypothetical protein
VTIGYNLINFPRRPATPEPIKDLSLTRQKERLIKTIAELGRRGH